MSNERTATYVEEVGLYHGYQLLLGAGFDPVEGQGSAGILRNYLDAEEALGICPDASDIDLMYVLIEAQLLLCGMGPKDVLARILRAAADVADGRR